MNTFPQLYDYMDMQLTHNQTYAFRLPPTFIEQARGLADFHENGVFSDKNSDGIGNGALPSLRLPCETRTLNGTQSLGER